jgi:membrane protein involved in colicin uptake
LETYVSNARKTLSDTIAAENVKAERLAAEKALAEKLAAEKLAAELYARRLREIEEERITAKLAKKQVFLDNINPKYDEAGKPTMGRTLITVALVMIVMFIVFLLIRQSGIFQ